MVSLDDLNLPTLSNEVFLALNLSLNKYGAKPHALHLERILLVGLRS